MLRAAVHHNQDNNALLSPRKRNIMRLAVVVAVLGLVLGTCCVAKLSDKRLCYDKDCSVVVSQGRTTLPYHAKDPDLLSFPGNVEVKVLSKSAGSRQDLWGVEINGKQGFVPKSFIRETRIIQKDLKYVVPIETATVKPVEKDIPKSETSTESSADKVIISAQANDVKAQVPKDEVSESSPQDTISPQEATPTFEYIYDGTVLPREIDEYEPVTPSYTPPQTTEDDVQLDIQPNIFSSPFTAFSSYFGSDDEPENESEENEESVELASSEKIETEDATEKTPEIVETSDESSPVSEGKPDEVLESVDSQKKVEAAVQETVSEVEVAESVPEVKVDEAAPDTKPEEVVQEAKVDEKTVLEAIIDEPIIEIKPDSQVHPELEELYKNAEVEKEQVADERPKISEEPIVLEEKQLIKETLENDEKVANEERIETTQVKEDSVDQVPSPNIVAEVSESADVQVQAETVESKSIVKDAPASIDTNTEKPFHIVVGEEVGDVKEVVDNVPNKETATVMNDRLNAEKPIVESLPAQEAIPSGQERIVDNNEFSTESNASTLVSSQDIVLDKQIDDVKDTLVNAATVEETITTEVPSKQEAKDESVTPSVESFVPPEPLYQPNISSDDGISSKQPLEVSENLTAPHIFVEESKSVESRWIAEEHQRVVETVVDSNNNVVVDTDYTTIKPAHLQNDSTVENADSILPPVETSRENIIVEIPSTPSFGEFLGNRNLLNAGKGFQYDDHSEEIAVDKIVIDEGVVHSTVPPTSDEGLASDIKQEDENISTEEFPVERNVEPIVLPMDTCDINSDCFGDTLHQYSAEANAVTSARKMAEFNSDTLLIVCITAVTTLLFSLGYYFLENRRRDAFLIAKINKLEASLMKTEKECFEMQEKFTSTKTKLDSIEDESFGSNEMVTSLKAELASSENVREELESQIATLEKELESTSEAGLELERMLREILSSQSEENNPLAQSIEELQTRLNDQQVANDSLRTALTVKTQENENLTGDLTVSIKKIEQLQAEVTKLSTELKSERSTKHNMEETLSSKIKLLELQVKSMSEDKNTLRKQLKLKELEVKELLDVVDKFNSNNLDFEKLYNVAQVKAEAAHLHEERDELRTKISDEEGARQLLEEHVRVVTEEVAFLSEQCKAAEKEKIDAKTQLEVLKRFFEEREAQRQKEEKLWLEKQGEHSSTVERLQTMQNEIINLKQQIEMSKREILDQEIEYKNQIAALETKAHEQWVTARQNERRLEEVKAESSQLRNRLTLVEKNINDGDPESKLHRLQVAAGAVGASNGEPERTPLYPGGSLHSSGESLDKSHHSNKV